MKRIVTIGSHPVGDGQPVFIVAEIGLNHNGDLEIAKKLIDVAVASGCNAVKFQKRTPELCVPAQQKNVMRETPWGLMTYLEYRRKVEFDQDAYCEIDRYCSSKNMIWFVSCWDVPSVDFMEKFSPVCYKIASASLTDDKLLRRIRATGRPVILSTGMSEMNEIRHAVDLLDKDTLVLCHTTSTYPCKHEEINLRMIETLRREFGCPVGYSGHEVGLQISLAASALGACLLERHITLDRSMWGSDHAASLEPAGLQRLVRDLRIIEVALGDGVKHVYASEIPIKMKLRKVLPADTVS